MRPSTLICLPSLSPSLPLSFFMPFPQLPLPSISVTFPLSLLLLPFISVLARPPSSHFCFITVVPLAVSSPPLVSFLSTETRLSLCPLFQSVKRFPACFFNFSNFLNNMPIKLNNSLSHSLSFFPSPVIISTPPSPPFFPLRASPPSLFSDEHAADGSWAWMLMSC